MIQPKNLAKRLHLSANFWYGIFGTNLVSSMNHDFECTPLSGTRTTRPVLFVGYRYLTSSEYAIGNPGIWFWCLPTL